MNIIGSLIDSASFSSLKAISLSRADKGRNAVSVVVVTYIFVFTHSLLPPSLRKQFIIYWYHAAEQLWDCDKALLGEGTEATNKWVSERLVLL